ncbi:MAG TPA: hypothetical protein H9699_00255 [Candidatus Gemmiger stercoravium]|nr:hypothetical protein [Candidatus Gemmiger stercoravium]
MLTNHDKDLACEITDFNTLTLVAATYTVYENLCTKKPIPKRDFLKQFEDNCGVFKKIMFEEKE